jgi:hypothetical protein
VGAIPPFPLYASIACVGKTLLSYFISTRGYLISLNLTREKEREREREREREKRKTTGKTRLEVSTPPKYETRYSV